MLLKKLALTAAGFTAGVAMTLASVGATATPATAQMTGDQAYAIAVKAAVNHATYQLDTAGLHALDDASNAGTIPSGALGSVRRARIAVQAAEWPEPLKAKAMSVVDTMKQLEEAIRSEDAAMVAPVAKKAHDDGHDLSAAVYTWLDTGKAPEGGHGH
jgi:hypothetical protein